jgi:hypothetical protein
VAACLAKDPAARPTPAQLIEACNTLAGTGGLVRHEGWWLPPAVAHQIAQQEQTMRLHSAPAAPAPAPAAPAPAPGAPAAAPQAYPVPTQPGLAPDAAFAAAAPTRPAHSPAEGFVASAPTAPAYAPHPAPPSTTSAPAAKRRRTPLIAALAVVGVLAVGGSSIAAYQLMADDSAGDGSTASGDSKSGSEVADGSGSGDTGASAEASAPAGEEAPKTEAGWLVSAQNKNLVFRAPKFIANAKDIGSGTQCAPGDVTSLEINDLEVSLNKGSAGGSGPWLTYTDCPDPIDRNGIRLADEAGAFSTTTNQRPTPTECRDTAREANLPNPIPLTKIKDDSLLKAGTGVCIESTDGPVIHLWITKVNKEPENNNLRTYVMTVTQWKPE